jgi:hypothetical protein
MLALAALVVVMANIQGALAPFSSLMPMLTEGTPDTSLAGTLAQARQQLAGSHRTSGHTPPALDAMVGDFARYHAVLAVVCAAVVIALLGLSTTCWHNFARTRSADRRVWGCFGAVSALSSLIVAVVLIANTGTATDPAPALRAFLNGGF